MPATAAERGLSDPFDPQQAIAQSAYLIADLNARFGNLGLAAAAYNGGPAAWASAGRTRRLPAETRGYVVAVTGRTADEWTASDRRSNNKPLPQTGGAAVKIL